MCLPIPVDSGVSGLRIAQLMACREHSECRADAVWIAVSGVWITVLVVYGFKVSAVWIAQLVVYG